jgi:arylsulfatase A-like enzyme
MAQNADIIGREILPIPDRPYQGYTPIDARSGGMPEQTLLNAPQGAPNIVIVLIDDMGFGIPSAFGGCVDMPTSDRLAETGLRYNQFHTTALCSPTRQAILTGRNHHSSGMGSITEYATSWPGNNGMRPNTIASVSEMLKLNGYNTAAFGKWHQTPPWEISGTGPFDRWPTGEGFEKFYGFQGGEIDQYAPVLYDGTTRVEQPKSMEEGYHISEDITDQAILWARQQQTLRPDKPFFIYHAFGATHAPHHVPESWRGRNEGKFDVGWDKLREQILERQINMGIVPADTQLTERPEGVKAWDELTDDEQLVASKLMENFADFSEHTDYQVGRLVDALDEMGVMDNTLFIYILGDNGCSAEGGLIGTHDSILNYNGMTPTIEQVKDHLDTLGGSDSSPHIPVGFAHAGNAPFQWTKQVASHYGGTRNGTIIHWPMGIKAKGEIRSQWHHVIDIVPTILEVAGLPQPYMVNGVAQRPIEGGSMAYTFEDADAPSRHTTQYFEMFGNRGIYQEGWTAVTKHRTPWITGVQELPRFSEDNWELYDTTKDFSQANNLAKEMPEKLRELQEQFLIEAAKYNVFPLDDRMFERTNPEIAGRPDLLGKRTNVTLYPGMSLYEHGVAPNLKNKSFTLTVELEVPQDGLVDGVLYAVGNHTGGLSFYLREGKPRFCYNMLSTLYYVEADSVVPSGKHEVMFHFAYDGDGVGNGGTGILYIDEKPVGEGRIEKTVPFLFSIDSTDVGMDSGMPVSPDYTSNKFTGGAFNWLRVDFGKDDHSHLEDPEHRYHRAMGRQ